MESPNRQDLDYYARLGRIAMKAGAFLVALTLIGAIYVHLTDDSRQRFFRALEPASVTTAPVPPPSSFPAQPQIPVKEESDPSPTF